MWRGHNINDGDVADVQGAIDFVRREMPNDQDGLLPALLGLRQRKRGERVGNLPVGRIDPIDWEWRERPDPRPVVRPMAGLQVRGNEGRVIVDDMDDIMNAAVAVRVER